LGPTSSLTSFSSKNNQASSTLHTVIESAHFLRSKLPFHNHQDYDTLSDRGILISAKKHSRAIATQQSHPSAPAHSFKSLLLIDHHQSDNMANPLDTDAGSELFSSYEAELKLVQADLSQKLDQIPELSGEPRKSAISQAERALEEANEIVSIPSPILAFPVRHTSCCW
jgi:hypothetical protein